MIQNNVGQTKVGKSTGTGATAETGMSALQQTEVGQKVSQAFLTEKGQLTGPLAGCGPEVLDMAYAMATGQLRGADDVAAAGAVRRFNIEDLTFGQAANVLPSQDRAKAARFSLPIPQFEGKPLNYPETYPKDMRNKDGTPHPDAGKPHPKAGKPLEDWQGNALKAPDGSQAKGMVFFNYEDQKYQGMQNTGDKVFLFNRPTAEQAQKMEAKIASMGGPQALNTPEKIETILKFAQSIGLDDRYDSDMKYAKGKLTAAADAKTGVEGYGVHMRANEMIKAVFVPGPAKVGDVNIGNEGSVFVLAGTDKATGKRDIRHVTVSAFEATHTNPDGTAISAKSLPRELPGA